jgi:putative FmdB family regulatory protein
MPTYKYKCKSCGEFEVFHSINNKLYNCPTCGNEVKKILTNCNFILKEGNFYKKSGD